MEVSYIEINECCRCCMNYIEELDNIFECFYKELQLHEILSLITGLSIAPDDGELKLGVMRGILGLWSIRRDYER